MDNSVGLIFRESARRPVSRVLSLPCGIGRPFLCDARCRAPHATNPGGEARHPWPWFPVAGRPYSVLLPVGFTLPPLLPAARCALTAPFHPSPRLARREVCFLWHFPWGRPRRPLAGTVFPWSPDFPPPPAGGQQRSSSRLARCRCAKRAGMASPGWAVCPSARASLPAATPASGRPDSPKGSGHL